MSILRGMDHHARREVHEPAAPGQSWVPTEAHDSVHEPAITGRGHRRHGGHGWMMIVCCIPMLVIAGLLVITGVAGSGIITVAVLCTAMMAAMMFMMPGGHGHR